jgi:hypothetical protein
VDDIRNGSQRLALHTCSRFLLTTFSLTPPDLPRPTLPAYFFHEGKPDEWERINSGDVARYRNTLVAYLKELEDDGIDLVYTPSGSGAAERGIIVTGGDGVSFGTRPCRRKGAARRGWANATAIRHSKPSSASSCR